MKVLVQESEHLGEAINNRGRFGSEKLGPGLCSGSNAKSETARSIFAFFNIDDGVSDFGDQLRVGHTNLGHRKLDHIGMRTAIADIGSSDENIEVISDSPAQFIDQLFGGLTIVSGIEGDFGIGGPKSLEESTQ